MGYIRKLDIEWDRMALIACPKSVDPSEMNSLCSGRGAGGGGGGGGDFGPAGDFFFTKSFF